MTDHIDAEVRVARWLTDEAEARAPERLIHATRERLAATGQSGRVRTLRLRFPTIITRTAALTAGVLAVAIVVAAVGSFLGLGSGPGFAPASESPTPRPSLTSLAPYACESGGGTCLGPLPAGVYETRSFVPKVGYIVPPGWTNTLDSRTQFDLSYDAGGSYPYPDGITFHDGISIFRRPIAKSSDLGTSIDGVGKTAGDLAQWLDSHANLDVSDLTPVTIGGAPGYRMRLSVPQNPSTSPDTCTSHGVPACVSLFGYDDPAATGGFGIVGPESAIVYLLDAPSGDTVMVVIDDVDGVDRDGLVAAATPIVDSLVFAP